VQSFDVYSPEFETLYSQVFWKALSPVPLPAHVVKRYDGRAMAVVGFELNQVRTTDNGTEVVVPISAAYNHHFESNMIGKAARFEYVQFKSSEDPRLLSLAAEMGHGLPSQTEAWMIQPAVNSADVAMATANFASVPDSASFGGANGGEVRKSFHGYAPGYAQLISSPMQFQITPMQIDTWNRDKMNLDDPQMAFVAGPVPASSLAPTGPDAMYSGLLECPLTTRVRKMIDGGYIASMDQSSCDTGKINASAISTAAECFAAASSTISADNFTTSTGSDATRPTGCSASVDSADHGIVLVYFNRISGVGCGADVNVLGGQVASLVTVDVQLNISAATAEITLVGPDDVWFGVGFGAQAMKDSPWAIIVEGGGKVSERTLSDQSKGTTLPSTVTVVTSAAADNVRTVVLRRPLSGTPFSFDPTVVNLPLINAVGQGPALDYHKNKAPASLSLLPAYAAAAAAVSPVVGACVCSIGTAPFGKAVGKLEYRPVASQPSDTGSGTVAFGNQCAPQPRTDLLAQRNPTCDVRTYVGGQIACHHMWSLLDAEQQIPWTDQPLKYRLKFRFWYQDYNASYHTNVKRTTWGIASPVEYDVPQCHEGLMGCSKGLDGTWVHTITGTYLGKGRLIAAHFHCHAPTCLSVAMYRNDTGELLCVERPVYGGTGQISEKEFDEPGFILQPPCLWGDAAFGLEPPPDVNGVMLHSVKTANATYGHHGEMAWQQMYYV